MAAALTPRYVLRSQPCPPHHLTARNRGRPAPGAAPPPPGRGQNQSCAPPPDPGSSQKSRPGWVIQRPHDSPRLGATRAPCAPKPSPGRFASPAPKNRSLGGVGVLGLFAPLPGSVGGFGDKDEPRVVKGTWWHRCRLPRPTTVGTGEGKERGVPPLQPPGLGRRVGVTATPSPQSYRGEAPQGH